MDQQSEWNVPRIAEVSCAVEKGRFTCIVRRNPKITPAIHSDKGPRACLTQDSEKTGSNDVDCLAFHDRSLLWPWIAVGIDNVLTFEVQRGHNAELQEYQASRPKLFGCCLSSSPCARARSRQRIPHGVSGNRIVGCQRRIS